MADQPVRALIVYGDGFMRHVTPRHSHLHALAAAGSCGFLALRTQTSMVQEDDRVVGELAQLLDLHNVYQKLGGKEDSDKQMPSMSERFMKIKSGMLSNCSSAATFGQQAGFTPLHLQEGTSDSFSSPLPEPSSAAVKLLSILNLQDATDDEKPADFELVLLHLKANQETETDKEHKVVEWTDKLIGALQGQTSPGTRAGRHLYLVVVLGYGAVDPSEEKAAALSSETVLEPKLASLVPRQSYTLRDGQPIEGVREHHPLLVVHHLKAVTRHDEVESFTFDEFKKHGGDLTIFVDRFLHEVAFKLWRSPKYGA